MRPIHKKERKSRMNPLGLETMPMFRLYEKVAEELGLELTTSRTICNAFVKALIDGLSEGRKVTVRGFGTFHLKVKPARPNAVVYDRKQQRMRKLPALSKHCAITFKPIPALREKVRKLKT